MFKMVNKTFVEGFEKIPDHLRWYIAGFLDGEGYFGLLKVRVKKKGQTSPYYYYPVVKVLNTNKEVIDFLESKLGGYRFKRILGHQWKDAHSLEFKSGKRILPFLEWLYPCLIVKGPICKLLIEFIKWQNNEDEIRTHRSQEKGLRGYNESENNKKEEFYLRCRALTARGIAVTTK